MPTAMRYEPSDEWPPQEPHDAARAVGHATASAGVKSEATVIVAVAARAPAGARRARARGCAFDAGFVVFSKVFMRAPSRTFEPSFGEKLARPAPMRQGGARRRDARCARGAPAPRRSAQG